MFENLWKKKSMQELFCMIGLNSLHINEYILFHGRRHNLGGSRTCSNQEVCKAENKKGGRQNGRFSMGERWLKGETLHEAPSVCASCSPRVLHRCTTFNKDCYQCRAAERSHLVNKRQAALWKAESVSFSRKPFTQFFKRLHLCKNILYFH